MFYKRVSYKVIVGEESRCPDVIGSQSSYSVQLVSGAARIGTGWNRPRGAIPMQDQSLADEVLIVVGADSPYVALRSGSCAEEDVRVVAGVGARHDAPCQPASPGKGCQPRCLGRIPPDDDALRERERQGAYGEQEKQFGHAADYSYPAAAMALRCHVSVD